MGPCRLYRAKKTLFSAVVSFYIEMTRVNLNSWVCMRLRRRDVSARKQNLAIYLQFFDCSAKFVFLQVSATFIRTREANSGIQLEFTAVLQKTSRKLMTLQQNVEYRLVVREVVANVQVNPSPFSPKSLLVNGAPKGIKVFAWGGLLFKIPWVPEEFFFKVGENARLFQINGRGRHKNTDR